MRAASKYLFISHWNKKFLHNLFYIQFCFLIFLSSQVDLYAEIRYVSKTGTSIPPYTSWETASDSIIKCINISNSGDTIYVANGIYMERIDMIPGLSLIGAGMDSCIINSSEVTPLGLQTIKMTDSCYLTGFHLIPSNNNQGSCIRIRDNSIQNKHVIVENNKLSSGSRGISITSYSYDNGYKLIRQNIIKNVNTGIYVQLVNPIVSENIIFPKDLGLGSDLLSNPQYLNNTIVFENASIYADGYDDFISNSTLMNNLFIIIDDRSASTGMTTNGDVIINNVIIGNFDEAIFTFNSVIKNNHIQGTKKALRYDLGSGQPPPVFQYNNLWKNQQNYQYFTGDSTNISVDPMFVNEDSLDFHLQKYSPLIDAGDPSILDIDGTRSDIGIFGGPFGEQYMYMDLAPRIPVNFTAVLDTNMQLFLSWNKNTETDFSHYRLYRDTLSQFVIDSTKLISEQTDTFYIQIIPPGIDKLYYKLTAVDSQANESSASVELAIIISSAGLTEPIVVNDYILYQNYPNPFNPGTRIGYRLKERGYVKLYVYDIKGELVETLVNQNHESGYFEAEFTARTVTKDHIASGMYFYQIMIRNENGIPVFSDIKKMIYVK